LKVKSEGLFSIQTPAVRGIEFVESVFKQLPLEVTINKASSVYQTNFERVEIAESMLICVLKYETELSIEELGQKLRPVASWLSLLTFNSLVALDPRHPLPNPLLYENKTLLRCAAEVWGNYRHPVLGQLLNELVGSDNSKEDIRFFSQGRVLV
jgi:hypothetical protein